MANTTRVDPEELPGYMKQERAAPKGVDPVLWARYLHDPDLSLSYGAWERKNNIEKVQRDSRGSTKENAGPFINMAMRSGIANMA